MIKCLKRSRSAGSDAGTHPELPQNKNSCSKQEQLTYVVLGCVIAVDLLFFFSMAAVVHLSAVKTVPGQVSKSLCVCALLVCVRACEMCTQPLGVNEMRPSPSTLTFSLRTPTLCTCLSDERAGPRMRRHAHTLSLIL